MPISAYGTTNPRGLEPFNIESVLAPLAVAGNKTEAQQMLNLYQNQRETAANTYGLDMQQQHDYAYQQLANQMYEARLKAGPEYLKAGGGALLGVGGIPGMGMGADPGVMQSVIDQSNAAEQAKTFQAGATGANQLSQGGYQVDPSVVGGIAGTTVGPYRGPALTQAATIRAAGQVAAANARGASAGSMGTSFQGIDPDTLLPVTGHASGKTSPEAIAAWKARYGGPQVATPPANQALPGVVANPSAPVAQTDTPANAPPATPPTGQPSAPTTPQNTAAGAAQVQQQVNANLHMLPKIVGAQGAADIQAGIAKNGGQPIVRPDSTKSNGWAIVGASGKTY